MSPANGAIGGAIGGAIDGAADRDQVETTLFRALSVLRFVVAAWAVILDVSRRSEYAHPVAAWTVIAVIVVWTFVAGWAYDAPRRRGLPLLVVDLVVAGGTLLSTRFVESEAMLDRHASTIPSFWVITAVLAWAVMKGWPTGLAVAALMSVLDVSVRTSLNGTTWGNIFLLLLAAGVVGYSTGLIREATEARAEAERVAAAMAERARLARAVHDGVLQALALVQRRGAEPGGDAELGRLAAEQEVALRALVQGNAASGALATGPGTGTGSGTGSGTVSGTDTGTGDLVEAMSRLASSTTTVSGPAERVLLAETVVTELTSAARAAVDNVERHVGSDARAWVLVEALGDRVVVTVRDEGPGIEEGRLEQARSEGRMGVSDSIRGRLADLGGRAELITTPGQGTEWELTVPVSRPG